MYFGSKKPSMYRLVLLSMKNEFQTFPPCFMAFAMIIHIMIIQLDIMDQKSMSLFICDVCLILGLEYLCSLFFLTIHNE